jgi:hypothetical protein
MKCHKGIPCIAILNKQKCHFFLLENQRAGGQNRSSMGGGIDNSGRGEDVGKGCRRVNRMQILCTCM